MSCWVVTEVAAEYLGVSADHVKQMIQDGSIPSMQEHGFTMVDVAPNSPKHQPARKPPQPMHQPEPRPMHESEFDLPIEPDINPVEESEPLGDWRAARTKAAKARRAPAYAH